MPFDECDRILLPSTNLLHELWPMLLAKALLKVAALEWVFFWRQAMSPLIIRIRIIWHSFTVIVSDPFNSIFTIRQLHGRWDGEGIRRLQCYPQLDRLAPWNHSIAVSVLIFGWSTVALWHLERCFTGDWSLTKQVNGDENKNKTNLHHTCYSVSSSSCHRTFKSILSKFQLSNK